MALPCAAISCLATAIMRTTCGAPAASNAGTKKSRFDPGTLEQIEHARSTGIGRKFAAGIAPHSLSSLTSSSACEVPTGDRGLRWILRGGDAGHCPRRRDRPRADCAAQCLHRQRGRADVQRCHLRAVMRDAALDPCRSLAAIFPASLAGRAGQLDQRTSFHHKRTFPTP